MAMTECQDKNHDRRTNLASGNIPELLAAWLLFRTSSRRCPTASPSSHTALAIAAASQKLSRSHTHKTPSTPTVRSAMPTSYSKGLGDQPIEAEVSAERKTCAYAVSSPIKPT